MKSVIPQFSYPTNEDVKKLLFSHEICEKLKYYVYAYYDPADMSFPFYIGKGKGNRCFQHLLDKSDSRKVSKIREIYDRGQKPVIEIVRFNLENEREALVAESMAIDLLGKELTNIKKGFQSRLFGRRSLDEIRRDLGSDDTIYINDLPDDSILININNTYVKDMALIDLYDATRACWRIADPRKKRLKYAIAIYKSVIKQVFIPEAWLPGDSTLRRFTTLADKQNPPDPEKKSIRWEFVGRVADDRQDLVGKRILDLPNGLQNPCVYSNSLKRKLRCS